MRWVKIGLLVCLVSTTAFAEDHAALIALLKSTNPVEYLDADVALLAIGPNAFEDVAALLKHKNRQFRIRAIRLLVCYAPQMPNVDRHATLLLKALADSEPEVSAGAAFVLGHSGPKTIPKLFSRSEGKDPAIAALARTALVSTGKRAIPYLSKKLEGKFKKNVIAALSLIEAIGANGSAATARVRLLLASEDQKIRAAAYRASAAIGSDAAKTTALGMQGLDDPAFDVVIASAQGLRHFPLKAAEALGHRLTAKPSLASDVAFFAYSGLGAKAAPAVQSLLESKDLRIRIAALRLLVQINATEQAMTRVHAILKNGEPAERIASTRMLSLSSDDADIVRRLLPSLITDKEQAVGDWAWYRAWYHRSERRPNRTPVVTEVLAKMGIADRTALAAAMRNARSDDIERSLVSIRALGIYLRGYHHGSPTLRTERVATLDEKVRASCTRGLERLTQLQLPSGFWSGGQPGCEIGVTALALLAFSAGGHTDEAGPFAETIRKGLDALVRQQRKDGRIGTPAQVQGVLQHTMATAALLDARLVGSRPDAGDAARLAVVKLLQLRNDRGVWSYRGGPIDGEYDLYHTIWACYAARLGTASGMVSLDRYKNQILWFVQKMTEPAFGQIGYDEPGGFPARSPNADLETDGTTAIFDMGKELERFPVDLSQSMTAAGNWARILVEDRTRARSPAIKVGFRLINDLPPKWDKESGRIDLVFWHFAANLFALARCDKLRVSTTGSQDGKDAWPTVLTKVLLDNQSKSGAWPPVGVWGAQGGESYSTATALLCLLAPAQFSPDFLSTHRKKLPSVYAEIDALLTKLRNSKDPRRAFAAHLALRSVSDARR